MTRAAARNVLHAAQVVFSFEVVAQPELVGERPTVNAYWKPASRRDVPHVKYLLRWAQELFGRAMAVQAPFHLQGSGCVHQRHSIYGPMAIVATDTLMDVNTVVEIHVIGKIIHPRPVERLS